MTPLRIAVIGAGLIGGRHIQTILGTPQAAELVAVADPQADPTHFELKGARWFSDAQTMLDQEKPEAVIVASPNALHAGHGQLLCDRGIHFLMEKPVTATLEEAADLAKAVRASGVKSLVGHHRRYLPAVRQAKQMIVDGAIGSLVAASVVWATRKPDAYFNTVWRRQAGAGPLLINAIHEIDLLRHLCGEILLVSGMKSNAVRGFEVEDTAVAALRFSSGCLATLTCTDSGFSPWTIEQGTAENPNFRFTHQSSYRLIGTQGSLELPVLRSWTARVPGDIGWDKGISGDYLPMQTDDPYRLQLLHLHDVIRQNAVPMIPVADGARTLAATLAIAQSSDHQRSCEPRTIAG